MMLFLGFCKVNRLRAIINIQRVMWLNLKPVLKIQTVFVLLMINLSVLKKHLKYLKHRIFANLCSQLLNILQYKVSVSVKIKNKF